MGNSYLVGAALFVAAAFLLYVGLPNREGESPRFLRFEAAPLLYPPIIIALLVGSIAAILTGYFNTPLRLPRLAASFISDAVADRPALPSSVRSIVREWLAQQIARMEALPPTRLTRTVSNGTEIGPYL